MRTTQDLWERSLPAKRPSSAPKTLRVRSTLELVMQLHQRWRFRRDLIAALGLDQPAAAVQALDYRVQALLGIDLALTGPDHRRSRVQLRGDGAIVLPLRVARQQRIDQRRIVDRRHTVVATQRQQGLRRTLEGFQLRAQFTQRLDVAATLGGAHRLPLEVFPAGDLAALQHGRGTADLVERRRHMTQLAVALWRPF